MIGEGWRFAAEAAAWSVAVAWCLRTQALMAHITSVPDLSQVQWDLCPIDAPGIIVVVPAKDEAKTLRPAMETLLTQDYPWMRIVAVDDRSTDGTGYLLEELAAAHPGKLDIVHLTEAAEGWTGKTFALQVALERSRSEFVLFTNADVWMSPSSIRRALAYAQRSRADHLVLAPTAVATTWGERTIVCFLQMVSLWVSRPWRVADPKARWDVAAAGAFNLLRREALEELGGLAPQRLAIVDGVTLGCRVRAAGMTQRLVFAPGLVLTHGAVGAWELICGMTKDIFALVNFRTSLQLLAVLGLMVLFLLPLAGLAWWPTLLPCLITLGCLAVCFRISAEVSQIPARYAWLYPLGLLAVIWATAQSTLLTWWRRGVLWRGTLYPLRELRPYNNPFLWEWQATEARSKRRRAERSARSSASLRFVRRVRQSAQGPHKRRSG